MISLIAAQARHNVIGHRNDLPWYLPADLRHFRDLTRGHTVLMGRKTFDSIVARLGKPLPDRDSIVVTRDRDFRYDGVQVIHSLDDIPKLTSELFIIGGAEIYRQMIDQADRLYITDIHADISGDTYFPAIDANKWREISRDKHQSDVKNPYDYDFVVYDRLRQK